MVKQKVQLGLLAAMLLYGYGLYSYRDLGIYWMGFAAIELAFWVATYYPEYYWGEWNTPKRVRAVAIAIRFCLLFLPVEVILSDWMKVPDAMLATIVLFSIYFDSGGGGKGGKRKRKAKKETKEVALA